MSGREKNSLSRKNLWRGRACKSLRSRSISKAGRNNTGKIMVRARRSYHRKLCRSIDFLRSQDANFIVERLEYDPGRSAHIALLRDTVSEQLSYVIAPNDLNVGDKISSGAKGSVSIGNSMELRNIPVGQFISCIEIVRGKGATVARSAGVSAQIIGRDGSYVIIRLPSGEVRLVPDNCRAVIGAVSNPRHMLIKLRKAGDNFHRGRKPIVRGVAKNPVDHPMGGGEGKASGGHPRSSTGVLAKGLKTRKSKRSWMVLWQRKKDR